MSALFAALINGGIAGAAVTIAVWLALSVAPRRALNAATRYAVWWIALLIVVALPVFYLPRGTEPAAHPQMTLPAESPTVFAAETKPAVVSDDPPQLLRWPRFPIEVSAGAWPGRISIAWAITAAFMLIRLCTSYVVLERRKRRAHTVEKFANWPVRVLISADLASPMAAGLYRPAILLPQRLLAELDDDEIEQIRLHETAHLLRRDDVALLLERTVEALFALHPVVRWITRRIDLEREIACDDFVVEQTGNARPYASCLTRVVELAGGVRSSIIAAAAAEDRSHLARRIEMLLDKTRHKGTRLLKVRLLLMLAAVMALACVVVRSPGLVAFAAAEPLFNQIPQQPPSSSWSEHSNHTVNWRTNDGLHTREMRLHGDVHFNDDDSDVQSMSADGFFSYEESFALSSRRYQATEGSSGQIQRRYMVDGRDKPFDADAQAWLRAALPDLLRDSGIDAAARVRRILKRGGVAAVLTEIGRIHSDGSKHLYIRELVPIGNLNTDQFQSVMRLVRGMNSDGEKAALLVFLTPYTLNNNLRTYTFEAVKTIHSDGEKHRVLTHFILEDSSRETYAMAARAALDINSDGEKAAVLVDLAQHLRSDPSLSHPFFRAAESIHSDGERARVLMAAIASAGEQRDTLSDALRAAGSMNSDGEKALVLTHADAYFKEDDSVRRAYFDSAATIHSDGEKARVLTSLVERGGLSARTLIEAVHCAIHINSDGEKARVLVDVADHSNGKADVKEEIKTAAGSIHSDGEYRRVMAAIDLRADNLRNPPRAR